MIVPMSGPDITDLEVATVSKVLQSGWLSRGPWVKRFERAFAQYVGVLYTLAVSSGTAGLHLACLAAGIKPGDEVITTPLSFVASVNCILYCGGRPVFVDIEEPTLGIDPVLAERAVTPNTVAILPVHLFHQACPIDRIVDVAKHQRLLVIEDTCEAIGAYCGGRMTGTFGDVAVFAFYPNKQMTTGEGGMVVTKNEGHYLRMRSFRNQGRADESGWLHHQYVGYNYRMDEMSAALGCVQLERLVKMLHKRAWVARWYTERLRELPQFLRFPYPAVGNRPSWYAYIVRLLPHVDRPKMQAFLLGRGIPTRDYFPALHTQPCYRHLGYREGQFPVAEEAAKRTLALPFSSVMTEEQVDTVCQAIKDHFRC